MTFTGTLTLFVPSVTDSVKRCWLRVSLGVGKPPAEKAPSKPIGPATVCPANWARPCAFGLNPAPRELLCDQRAKLRPAERNVAVAGRVPSQIRAEDVESFHHLVKLGRDATHHDSDESHPGLRPSGSWRILDRSQRFQGEGDISRA